MERNLLEREISGLLGGSTHRVGQGETDQFFPGFFKNPVSSVIGAGKKILAPHLISRQLQKFYEGFVNIPVRINPSYIITVRPPYYMSAGKAERRESADKNRRDANKDVQSLLKGMPQDGKATPEGIKKVLEAAVSLGQIIPAGNKITSNDLRKWLVKYGIGIDCSGFVSQAINSVVDNILSGNITQGENLHIANTHSSELYYKNKKFIQISSPSDLMPGDTMYIPGHIRIIQDVRKFSDRIEIATIESTSTPDDIGPYRREWKFTNFNDFKTIMLKKEDDGGWKKPGTKDVNADYSRFRQIDAYLKNASAKTHQSSVAPSVTSISDAQIVFLRSFFAAIIPAFNDERDPDKLTDWLFFLVHPERNNRKIAPEETAAIKEWKMIQDRVVVPGLQKIAMSTSSSKAEVPEKYNYYATLIYRKDSKNEYIRKYAPAVVFVCEGTGLFPSVMMAQLIIESNWGKDGLVQHNNFFGIKADKNWSGKTIKRPTPKDATKFSFFRAYPTLLDGFKDRVRFLLENSRYTKHGVFKARSPEEQTKALRLAGYAENGKYDQMLNDIINQNNLKQLDSKIV